jgi:hypothetical protein
LSSSKKKTNSKGYFFKEEVIDEWFVNSGDVKPFMPKSTPSTLNKREHTAVIAPAGITVTSRTDCKDKIIRFLNDGTTTRKDFKGTKCIISVNINNRK